MVVQILVRIAVAVTRLGESAALAEGGRRAGRASPEAAKPAVPASSRSRGRCRYGSMTITRSGFFPLPLLSIDLDLGTRRR